MKISITRALVLKKKKEEELAEFQSNHLSRGTVGTFIPATNLVYTPAGAGDKDLVKKAAQSTHDTFTSLVESIVSIREAIALSNAKTVVTIAGNNYTVAQAILVKSVVLPAKEKYLGSLRAAYSDAMRGYERQVKEFQGTIESALGSAAQGLATEAAQQARSAIEVMRAPNKPEFYDPSNMKDMIERLEKEIKEFSAEIDWVLQQSNAIQEIEVEL